MKGYWEQRSGLLYYYYVASFVSAFGAKAKSAIDVGAKTSPVLEWFDWLKVRHALDISSPYSSDIVQGIEADFYTFQPERKYDLALCLQVLEHVPDAQTFARKLFEVASRVIISVPYCWPEGETPVHVHDPVDEHKLERWTGRKPTHSLVVQEPLNFGSKNRRLICYYHPEDQPLSLIGMKQRMRPIPEFALPNIRPGTRG